MQQRYLHNDAVMCKTFNKLVGHPAPYFAAHIVVHLMVYIHHRLFYVAHTMPQQIHCHHRQGKALGIIRLGHILGIGVMRT